MQICARIDFCQLKDRRRIFQKTILDSNERAIHLSNVKPNTNKYAQIYLNLIRNLAIKKIAITTEFSMKEREENRLKNYVFRRRSQGETKDLKIEHNNTSSESKNQSIFDVQPKNKRFLRKLSLKFDTLDHDIFQENELDRSLSSMRKKQATINHQSSVRFRTLNNQWRINSKVLENITNLANENKKVFKLKSHFRIYKEAKPSDIILERRRSMPVQISENLY